MVSRRTFLAVAAAGVACSRRRAGGYRGYAFIANQEGQAVAAVDLEVMAVARHIGLPDAPTQMLAAETRPAVYALTPASGSVHEIQVDRLSLSRTARVAAAGSSISLSPDERSLYVLASEPRALISVSLETFRPEWTLRLPQEPVEFTVAPDGQKAAITSAQGIWIADLPAQRLSGPLHDGDFGAVRFRRDGKLFIAANRGGRVLSVFDSASGGLVAHLPVPVRPDHLCSSQDGGQLFVTGEGMDGVVIAYPYQVEVAKTVLAGHAPGAMAASQLLLFVASPQSGDVSILSIQSQQVIAVVQVGADPGFVTITPDDQYALVLNRKSGDLSVIRVAASSPDRYRYKSGTVLTVIPVGSRPVSAAVRGV